MVTISDLQAGVVARIKPGPLAKLAGEALSTVHRKIREGELPAVIDEANGRLYVPAGAALKYLKGQIYRHNPQDDHAISRMEHARRFKQAVSNG